MLGPAVIACSAGEPAKIVVGKSDTVVVNNIRAVRIPVRVTDRSGAVLRDTTVRFMKVSSDPISITEAGIVTCDRPGDAIIRASAGKASSTAMLYCRPVEKVRIGAPIQFVMPGDSAQTITIQPTDASGNAVSLFSASIVILDTTVATIVGGRVLPRAPGATVVGVRVGNRDAGAGVHVYERVKTLDELRPDQRIVAVPLKLSPGESRQWDIGRGEWMLTMLPEDDEANGIRLRVEGATCNPGFTPRRYVCGTRTGAKITVYHPASTGSGRVLTGTLLVRHLED